MLWTLLTAAAATGQTRVFSDGFETGMAGEWDRAQPARCDRIDTFARGKQPSQEIFVATWGDDLSGDGSAGSPYATIERAIDDAVPGAAVRIHPGTYSGRVWISDLAGTADQPIWIGGVPGETRPVISGGDEGMHLSRVAHLVVHDLEVAGATYNGINCDDGGDYDNPLATYNVVFRRLAIHDIGSDGNQDCLKLSGVDHYWVLDSEFARCGGGGSGSGVDHVGCHDGLLARNWFHDLSGNAIQSKGGSTDIEIRWNRFADSGQRSLNLGGSTGFEYFRPPLSTTESNAEARNLAVVANVFEGSIAPIAYVGCVGCVVANNTIIDPDNWILRILQETTTTPPYTFEACRNGVFMNNLVYFNRNDLSTDVNVGPNTDAGSFTFANNLWYAWDNPSQSQPNLPAAESGGLYGDDPDLDDAYRIGTLSPAAGAGTPTAHAWGDLDGLCYAATPSIGAFRPR
ncbi:MAG: hypothetical protein PVG92_02715 [Holophagae bacterium]|jgi:hypothetical protein